MATTIEGPTILNIAGEIINLSPESHSNNSGRMNVEQFKKTFSITDSDFPLLQKVFGIPTLRHTPTILTEKGCFLDDDEKKKIVAILTKRKDNLNEGISLTRGFGTFSSNSKIKNYERLISRIDGGVISSKEPCEAVSLKEVSIPAIKDVKEVAISSNSEVQKLLLLIVTLLVGISTNKDSTIRNRLGNSTIEQILSTVSKKSNSLTTNNLTNIIDRLSSIKNTNGNPTSMLKDILKNVLPTIEDKDVKSRVENLVEKEDVTTSKLETGSEKEATLKGELSGLKVANEKLEALSKALTGEVIELQNRFISTNDKTTKDELSLKLEKTKNDKKTLQSQITSITAEMIEKTASLEKTTEENKAIKEELDTIKASTKTLTDDIVKLTNEKQKNAESIATLQQDILAKQEIIAKDLKNKENAVEKDKSMKNEIDLISSRLTDALEEVEKQKDIKSKLDVLQTAYNSSIEASKITSATHLEELSALQGRETSLETELSALESLSTENTDLLSRISTLTDNLEIARKELEEKSTNSAKGDLENQLIELQTREKVLTNISKKKNEKISSLEKNLHDITIQKRIGNSYSNTARKEIDKDNIIQEKLTAMLLQLDLIDLTKKTKDELLEINPLNYKKAVKEPQGEKICVLYYFVSFFWKTVVSNLKLEESIKYREFITDIDTIYIGKTEDSNLWENIDKLTQLLDYDIINNKSIIPSNLLSMVNTIEKNQLSKKPMSLQTTAFLQDILEDYQNILPDAKKTVSTISGNRKSFDKTFGKTFGKTFDSSANQISILSKPFIFLMLMRVLSRYVKNKLNDPNLDCKGLKITV